MANNANFVAADVLVHETDRSGATSVAQLSVGNCPVSRTGS